MRRARGRFETAADEVDTAPDLQATCGYSQMAGKTKAEALTMHDHGQHVPARHGAPAMPAAHDEFAEVLGIVRDWPAGDRLALVEELGLMVGGDVRAMQRAFDQGREDGEAIGQRRLLERIFAGATTGRDVIENAALAAFVETWPEDEPCPLSASDLASLAGVSERTAARRIAAAKMAVSFADKQRAECASVAVTAIG